ncbi:MAG: magnesium transporter [Clostridia bacterium]|nr:magnesium transporter [Clostridia bacterium]
MDLSQTIETLLERRQYNSIRDILVTVNAADIAVIFEDQPADRLLRLFRLLPKELAADVFVEMDTDLQQELINGFSDKELSEILNEMYDDDAADLVDEMPANVVNRILKQADPEMRRTINELLKYPEDSAGSIMTTDFVDLRPTMTAKEAIDNIRKTGVDKETIETCYVTEKRKLIGTVTLRELVLADEDALVSDLMDENFVAAETKEDSEAVADMFAKYDLLSIPVVDSEMRLVGIVTVDDAIDVIRDEATEDIEKMAAITPSDKPYPRLSVFELYKNRIPWLMLLMISATFTQLIIRGFEDALSQVVLLTAYIPMIMDTGGNSGSQASVTIIRSISLGEVEFKDIFKVIFKEFRVAILCGLTLATLCFGKLMLIDGLPATGAVAIALTVSGTLFITVILAKFFGCTLPLLVKKIGLDPAVMASPMITTVVDALSLLVYFLIASNVVLPLADKIQAALVF